MGNSVQILAVVFQRVTNFDGAVILDEKLLTHIIGIPKRR